MSNPQARSPSTAQQGAKPTPSTETKPTKTTKAPLRERYELDTMNAHELKQIAQQEEIELPKNVTKRDDMVKFLKDQE
jgi:hypothetical protein